LNGRVSGLRIKRLLILLQNDSLASQQSNGSTTCLPDSDDSVPITLVSGEGVPKTPEIKKVACHKKNPDLGEKDVYYSDRIFVEQEDARTFKKDEEVFLSDIATNSDYLDGLGKRNHS
jgi:tRNA synthetases class I (E and Q), anti-codon binding domain